MAADRRVNAARPAQLVRVDHLRVKLLTHSVQPLELVFTAGSCVVQHARQRMRVVRRELRVQDFTGRQCLPGAGEVGNIRMTLARKYRVTFEAQLLAVLDFSIPVGPFDEAHRNTPSRLFAERLKEPDDFGRTSLIRLDSDPEAIISTEFCAAHDLRKHLQRNLEPICFFRVNRECDARCLRMLRQFRKQRNEFLQDTVVLQV